MSHQSQGLGILLTQREQNCEVAIDGDVSRACQLTKLTFPKQNATTIESLASRSCLVSFTLTSQGRLMRTELFIERH